MALGKPPDLPATPRIPDRRWRRHRHGTIRWGSEGCLGGTVARQREDEWRRMSADAGLPSPAPLIAYKVSECAHWMPDNSAFMASEVYSRPLTR